jgi:hypothetical protein
LAIEHARGGELGGGIKQAADDQGLRQIAPALWCAARQQLFEFDAALTALSALDLALLVG